MSKNLTRKGLAISATAALALSGFSALPANAYGLADETFVSLVPKEGTAYGVLTGSTFDLRANFADALSGVSSRTLKFLVEDPSAISRADVDVNLAAADTAFVRTKAITSMTATNGANAVITVTVPDHNLTTGDTVTIGGTATVHATPVSVAGDRVVTVIDRNTFTYPTTATSDSTVVTSTNPTVVFKSTVPTAVSSSGTTYTVTVPSTANIRVGDSVTLAGFVTALNGAQTVTSVLSSTQFTFTEVAGEANTLTTPTITMATPFATPNTALSTRADLVAHQLGNRILLPNSVTIEPRKASDNSYVVRTNVSSNASNTWLRLVSTSTSTQSVSVTAWMDSNGNDLIDSTEYASPTRVVQFLASSSLTPNITFAPFKEGDTTITNRVRFTPALNGEQLVAAQQDVSLNSMLSVAVTRPGSTLSKANPATPVWDEDNQWWNVTSINMNNSTGAWGIAQPTASGTLLTQSISITKDVVTVITSTGDRLVASRAAHGLQVGDKVTIGSATTSRADKTDAVITSVPTANSFTYAAAATGADVVATTQSAGAITWSEGNIKRNLVVPGTYTATVSLYNYALTSPALAVIGTAASASIGANVAESATISAVGSENVGTTSATQGVVRAGTKTAEFVVSVFDEDLAVLAGVPVNVAAVRGANPGTVKANGTTLTTSSQTITGVTDANGQFKVSLENSSALAGETVTLTVSAQATTLSAFTVTWQAPVFRIHDLADQTRSSDVRNRAVAPGEAYTFNFLVTDQFKKVAGSNIRLQVAATGRTVSTTNVALTNGAASLAIPDGAIGTGTQTTVNVSFQVLSGTTWADVDTASYIDWAGAAGEDLAPVVINYVTGTHTLTLNADASNVPGGTTADFSAAIVDKPLKAVDLRTSFDVAASYLDAAKAVVSGRILAANGVAKAGARVTVSGTGVLFNVGDVWSLNTITFTSNDGTFAVNAYSSSAGTKVVTVADGAVSRTASLVFTGIIGDPLLTLTTPANVKPASTFQVKAKLADSSGNPVDTAAGRVKVTYSGPGIVFGTLPDQTDATGELMFSVLLGSNDTGNIVVTVSYDQNGDADFVDAKDLNSTKTITVGTGAASGTGKVNVGSFNGKLVVYASGLNGKRISWKVGGNWGSAVASSNYAIFNRPTPRAGVTVSVDIYVNGVKTLTKSVVTR